MATWWEQVLDALREDFGDVPDVGHLTQIAVRLMVAAVLGGVLGYERERAGKSAGMRTHMLVALGSAVFVLVPQQAGASPADLTRVVVTDLRTAVREHPDAPFHQLEPIRGHDDLFAAGRAVVGKDPDVGGRLFLAVGLSRG